METEHQEPIVTPEPPAEPKPAPVPQTTPAPPKYSEFDGTTLQLIGWRLLGILLSAVTLGIATPWAQCMVYRWETKHTLVEGKRLRFDGTGLQLLGNYLLWGLLTLFTFGIFAIFLPVRMHKWRAEHTKFADEKNPPEPVSGWAIAAAVLAALLVLTLAGGGAYLYLDKHPIQDKPQLPEDLLSLIQGDRNDSLLPDGDKIYIQDGDSIIIWTDGDNLPTQEPESTVPEGIRPPNADDDVDYWYVDSKGGMNVRSGPDVSYQLLRKLPHGTEVKVLDWENGWAFLGDGWIAGNYLEINRPKDAIVLEEGIVGKWAFIREEENWDMEAYYVVVFQFRADGTFQSETALVSYDEIGGSYVWVPEGVVKNTAFQGTYTYDGSDLRLEYLEEDDNDWDVYKRLELEAYWDGEKLQLDDYEDLRALGEDEPMSKEGKAYPVLLPMDDDANMDTDLCSVVRRYLDR